jgi:hypothetical protein
MKFRDFLAVGAVVALMGMGANVAKADGGDPRVKITVPTDPVIEPCSSFSDTNIECFTSNSISNPVVVAGPTGNEVGSFDFLTNFIYEPTNCVGDSCPSSDILSTLWIEINPTIPGGAYNCDLGTVAPGVTPAFNQCPAMEGVSSGGLLLLELACNPTPSSPCTGMLPGQEGSSEIAPEPGEFVMLGMGILLVGLYQWKSRSAMARRAVDHAGLAVC